MHFSALTPADAPPAERGWRTVRVRNLDLLNDAAEVLDRLRTFVSPSKPS